MTCDNGLFSQVSTADVNLSLSSITLKLGPVPV